MGIGSRFQDISNVKNTYVFLGALEVRDFIIKYATWLWALC